MLREQARRGTSRFGEQGDKCIGASHRGKAHLLGMKRGALIDALEGRRRLGAPGLGHGVLELVVEILHEALPQVAEIGVTGTQHGGCFRIVDQREQKMLERRVLVVTPLGVFERMPLRGCVICRHRTLRHIEQLFDALEPFHGIERRQQLVFVADGQLHSRRDGIGDLSGITRLIEEQPDVRHQNSVSRRVILEALIDPSDQIPRIADRSFADVSRLSPIRCPFNGKAAKCDTPKPSRQHPERAIGQRFEFEQLGHNADLVDVRKSGIVDGRLSLDRQHDLPSTFERLVQGLEGALAAHKHRVSRIRKRNEIAQRSGGIERCRALEPRGRRNGVTPLGVK